MRTLISIVLVCIAFSLVAGQAHPDHHGAWVYECHTDETPSRCVKVLSAESPMGMPLNKCKLTCGVNSVLWPKPTETPQIGDDVMYFLSEDIQHSLNCQGEVCDLLSKAVAIFKEKIDMSYPYFDHATKSLTKEPTRSERMSQIILSIQVSGTETHLALDMDESYSFYITSVDGQANVIITAATFFGARHALETLSQLINYDHERDCLQIVDSAIISDAPEFTYRGILLDTSRNFYPMSDLKRTIDGMATTKLNSFHWHITDTASWPLEIPSLPNITHYGAYSDEETYSPEEIREFVEYARVRGIRVIPEIDAPAHVGNGFQWGAEEGLGEITVCTNRDPWYEYCVEPPCGQVNLANPEMYNVFNEVYKTIADSFGPIDLFHYGGDEVNLHCWNTTDEVVNWMLENDFGLSEESYYEQWGIFQQDVYDKVNAALGKEVPGIIWTSSLTKVNAQGGYLSPDQYIIQIWTTGTDPEIQDLLNQGFRLIFSNYDELYLDCGIGSWVGDGGSWCDPYKSWKMVYENNPTAMGGDHLSQVLGGEAALWSETADEHNMDVRLWPRAAALGERLWSNPSENWRDAAYRMIYYRQRLEHIGIKPDRLQPEWCNQNEHLCVI